jgi:hypothetical protein
MFTEGFAARKETYASWLKGEGEDVLCLRNIP